MNRNYRFLLPLLCALLLAAGCARARQKSAAPAPRASLPADVRDLAAPEKPGVSAASCLVPAPAQAEAPLAATGELVSPARSRVAARQPGRVAAVYVREGARVAAGQPLAALETEYLRLDLERAEAELARAEAVAGDAARDLERKRQLVLGQSVSRAAFEHVQSSYDAAVAARRGAAAAAATIRQRIADATLRAPFDGVVESKAIDVGEHLGDGQAAFVLVATSKLRLRFRLPERYLGKIRTGQRVDATADAAGAFTGRLAMIGGVIDPATRTLVAEADVDNSAGRLEPGMFARVQIAQ